MLHCIEFAAYPVGLLYMSFRDTKVVAVLLLVCDVMIVSNSDRAFVTVCCIVISNLLTVAILDLI